MDNAAGPSRLQSALAVMLRASRGLAVDGQDVVVTRGSQMALYLVARVLVRRRDVVVVENPGYCGAWDVFRLAGARVIPVGLDDQGLRTDELVRVLARQRVRLVFVTPHHQYPTTVTMSAARRLELMQLAAKHRFAIVEDDYDYEFHFENRPVLPLAAHDPDGVVLYLGTLSKVLAPGLRTGFLVAPPALAREVRHLRTLIDVQGDSVGEAALAALFEDGEIQRHLRRSRRIYRARRDAAAHELRCQLGEALTFRVPAGGMAIWAGVAPDIDLDTWIAKARAQGVALGPSRDFYLDGRPRPFLRLGFTRFDAAEMRTLVRRLAEARPA
jgi:GntR family transcriptional regulator/MocR family aminotransferase